eukprot:1143977-Pelagomonas_calceolata.AAC.1
MSELGKRHAESAGGTHMQAMICPASQGHLSRRLSEASTAGHTRREFMILFTQGGQVKLNKADLDNTCVAQVSRTA